MDKNFKKIYIERFEKCFDVEGAYLEHLMK